MGTREFLRWLVGLSDDSRARRAITDTPHTVTGQHEADAITSRLRS